jgi:hypothetical protein
MLMRGRTWIVGVAGLLVVGLGLGSMVRDAGANSVQGKTGSGKRFECTDRMIKGTYGIQMQGTRPVPGGTGLEAMIGVNTRTYDGAGNFTQVDNAKGAISGIVPDRPGSGTYQVNADCSGTTLFAPGPGVLIEERFVIVDYGHEIRSITASPQPLMISTVAKRTGFR